MLTLLFVTLEVSLEIIIPLFMAEMIDKGITNGNMNVIVKIGIRLILMCILTLLNGALSGRFGARASAGFAKNLRHKLFYKIQDFSFGYIDKFSSAGLVTRLTTDVTNVQNAFQMIIRVFARAPLMLISFY